MIIDLTKSRLERAIEKPAPLQFKISDFTVTIGPLTEPFPYWTFVNCTIDDSVTLNDGSIFYYTMEPSASVTSIPTPRLPPPSLRSSRLLD